MEIISVLMGLLDIIAGIMIAIGFSFGTFPLIIAILLFAKGVMSFI